MVIAAVSVRDPRVSVIVDDPVCVYVCPSVFVVMTWVQLLPCDCMTCVVPSPQFRLYALQGVAMSNSTSTESGLLLIPGVTTNGLSSTDVPETETEVKAAIEPVACEPRNKRTLNVPP